MTYVYAQSDTVLEIGCNTIIHGSTSHVKTRKFSGPFLVVWVPGPVNVVLQQSEQSRSFCLHVDKVKKYIAEYFPKS